eukprot:675620_1
MATGGAANRSFRKRLFKTGMTILCSAFLGGAFTAEALRRKARTNSLALNIMSLPSSHREMLTTFENLEDAQLTPLTYLSSAESLLPHVRKLKTNIATHHILRIQAASFLKRYHNALFEMLNDKVDKGLLELEEFGLYQRRRLSDMKLAFDFVNFKASEVSDNITNIVKFTKMDYARMARDGKKLRIAFDEIYNTNKQTKQKVTLDTMDDKEKQKHEETRQNLLEHELMALYTHAPYLGEWDTFMKIGNALYEEYGQLEPIHTNSAGICGHDDGINFNDIYCIGKDVDIVNEIPTLMESNLKFNVRPIEYIKIKYASHEFRNQIHTQTGGWFGKEDALDIKTRDWIHITNDSDNDSIIPLGICRLGGVQKTISISKCVPRVQGPIFYDNKIKMRGSVMLMVPSKTNDKRDGIVPNNAPLNGVNDFIQIQQIEEWDLKPVEVGNLNEFEGKVTIRREPVNDSDVDACDPFQIQYDCILKLQSKVEDYY